MRETIKAAHAFDVYWQLGDQRTLAKVGQALGKSTTLIEHWSAAHRWSERVKQKQDAEAAARDARHQQLVAGVEQQLLTDGIELQALAMDIARKQAPKGRLSPALAPLLAQARGMAMRGLRLPESITRQEQTGAGGGPVRAEHHIKEEFDWSGWAGLFRTGRADGGPAGDGDGEPLGPADADPEASGVPDRPGH